MPPLNCLSSYKVQGDGLPNDPFLSQTLMLWRADLGYVDQRAHDTFDTTTAPLNTNASKFGTPTAQFDGTANKCLISSTGTGGQLKSDSSTYSWTIEAWIYVANGSSGDRSIVANQNNASVVGAFMFEVNPSGKLQIVTNVARCISNTTLSTGAWHHVAVDKNLGNPSNIWIDGVLDVTGAAGYASDFSGTVGLAIGSRLTPGNCPFNGAIDSVRITQAIRYTANFTPIQFSTH